MIKKLIPLLLALIGLGAGVGAGLFLRPAPDTTATAEQADHAAPAAGGEHGASSAEAEGQDTLPEYVKLPNQFIVPVLEKERITSMVILSLSLEVAPGSTERVFSVEPKLRDGFLQVLFDHANAGGFNGSFTDAANLVVLREGLLQVAVKALGPIVTDVLITDIVRQDN
jgi:flagellar protein FliL